MISKIAGCTIRWMCLAALATSLSAAGIYGIHLLIVWGDK